MERREDEKTSLHEVLKKYGIRAKKNLGQHWLVSEDVIRKIIGACGGAGGILEIGPGIGILTKHLVNLAPTWAIEIDERLEKPLKVNVPDAKIFIGDVLKVDLINLLSLIPHPRVIVSNIPFYITTPILERLLSVYSNFDWAVIMLQKEVGEKLMAKVNDSKRITLSVLYQYHFNIEIVCKVNKRDFVPPPSVNAMVLKLLPKVTERIQEFLEESIRVGFRYPRKTLLKNFIAQGIGDRRDIETWLTTNGIAITARPHQLSVEDWVRLASQVPFRKN
ncbi:MAG TPA: 16S rRNA (adenine(1518)-N(6)/adenine(1519)-N(6))-dimethyltransferase RsmA [Fimbriimonadales bacterium]|nr:16S rRNA (adenine(1518)-N(6)/adenine(1519)-N(6))-dimethyltransferase RsmA [Fimbriimonadales bacterium]